MVLLSDEGSVVSLHLTLGHICTTYIPVLRRIEIKMLMKIREHALLMLGDKSKLNNLLYIVLLFITSYYPCCQARQVNVFCLLASCQRAICPRSSLLERSGRSALETDLLAHH